MMHRGRRAYRVYSRRDTDARRNHTCLGACTRVRTQALRRHQKRQHEAAEAARSAFHTEADAITAWSSEAAEKLSALLATAAALPPYVPPADPAVVERADRMLEQFEREFRESEKTRWASRRRTLHDEATPRLRETLRANAAADARFLHQAPPYEGRRETRDGDASFERAVKARLGELSKAAKVALEAAEQALTASAESVEAGWGAMEAVESAYDRTLWGLLVEKQTDLMVEATGGEARAIQTLALEWAARFADPNECGALSFDDRVWESWPAGGGDSAAALRASLAVLGEWGDRANKSGVLALEERRAACHAQYKDTVRRRAFEGRSPPPNVDSTIVEAAWEQMRSAAGVLHTRCDEMVAWQRKQADASATALREARWTLGSRLPSADVSRAHRPDGEDGGANCAVA